ncbi:hypothetical protein [Flavobacterium sp.]|uniref:hypothetical protein n=1 Tax=Flavobacterium sp. TaxID=239 RepID=UPI002B4B188B|nr:hypothetical protein [Flavobacterium sp.]HLP64448.1 hypothetical protein [Flavobacterium sp.]
MKTLNIKKAHKNTLLFIFIIAMMLIFSSCSKKVSFLNSSVVPAARGNVVIDKDNNENYTIKIDIKNLAEVERLNPPRKTYVVWLQTSERNYKNLGQIESSSSRMSSKLDASFKTVSSFKPSKIMITAEDDGEVSYPSNQIILTTEQF